MKQRNDNDCAVCCLAMLLNVGYDKLAEHQPGFMRQINGRGASLDDIDTVLQSYGHQHSVTYKRLYVADLDSTTVKKMLTLRPAIIVAPSLNNNGLHMVYWDGHMLHDPSPKKQYTMSSLVCKYVWVFSGAINETTSHCSHL